MSEEKKKNELGHLLLNLINQIDVFSEIECVEPSFSATFRWDNTHNLKVTVEIDNE